ncbi:hypothetical protein ON010_g10373 [Phytophthora cinnamomi]|nr:hypothetical protein ON010_g10373 [Phytophthora cinnamomi]
MPPKLFVSPDILPALDLLRLQQLTSVASLTWSPYAHPIKSELERAVPFTWQLSCIRKRERCCDGRRRAVGGAARAPRAVLQRGPREAAPASAELLPVGAPALSPVRDVLRRRRLGQRQAADGFKLFDAILDGMEAEELEYLEYERSLNQEKQQNNAALATEQANMSALEDRLKAMRLAKKNAEQPKVQAAGAAVEKEGVRSLHQSAPMRAQISRPLETRQKERSQTVSYPSVGKASWMTPDAAKPSHKHYSAPPLSRQRSQEAIANLTSGKIRTLEIPAGIIAQFTLLASPNTNQPPYGIETCGILAGILVRSFGDLNSDTCHPRPTNAIVFLSA